MSVSPCSAHHPTRRDVLARLGGGFGGLVLGTLLGESYGSEAAPARNDVRPRPPHFPAKARAVIQLFMHGGPSHVDLLDPKPLLEKHDGQDPQRACASHVPSVQKSRSGVANARV